MVNGIFDKTLWALENVLEYRLKNQNVIASNIANANTPGYKAKELVFEDALRDALDIDSVITMKGSSPKHIKGGSPFPDAPMIVEQVNNVSSIDGNTVDSNEEMVKMAENQLIYNAASDMVKRKMALLKYAISEGGK